jgi:hypothetical protein
MQGRGSGGGPSVPREERGGAGFPWGIGLKDPRSQKRDLGHPSILSFTSLWDDGWVQGGELALVPVGIGCGGFAGGIQLGYLRGCQGPGGCG